MDQQRADTAALMAKGEIVLDSPPSPSPSPGASAVDSSSEVSTFLAVRFLFIRDVHVLISFFSPILLFPTLILSPCLAHFHLTY